MAWAPVGSVVFASASTFTLDTSAATIGDLVMCEIINASNGTVLVSSLTSSNATWAQKASLTSGATNIATATAFVGQVSSLSSQLVTIAWSGAAPAAIRVSARIFHSSLGTSWAYHTSAILNSAGTATWPSLTPSVNGELYWGFTLDSSTAAAGSTSGYVYEVDPTNHNGEAYKLSCPSGTATDPVWTDAHHLFGIAVLITDATSTSVTVGGATGVVAVSGGSPFAGTAFPVSPLGITVELLLNGTWTDITSYVYSRDDISITQGRPNETGQVQPGSLTLTLNNQGGDFSPKNSGGMFYPYIGRNVQIRLSVNSASANGTPYSGYRFWGEVSNWPPQWDLSGNDVYVQIQAGGLLRRYVQGGLVGSCFKRFYIKKSDVTTPVAFWSCEEQSNASQFNNAEPAGSDMTWTGTPGLSSCSDFPGVDPIPLISKSIWTGSTGSFSSGGPVTFSTPGTYLWTAPGGVTSLTSAETWAGGSGGAGDAGTHGSGAGGGSEYAKETSVAVTPGNSYLVTVGAGGSGGAPGHNGVAGGFSQFSGDSVIVTSFPGGPGLTGGGVGGTGGTGSANTTHHNGGNGGTSTGLGGAGGGGSAGTAAAGNNGSNTSSNTGGSGAAAVTGGGAGGKGGNGSTGHGATGGSQGATPGAGGGGAGTEPGTRFAGGNGAAGKVVLSFTSSTTPNNVIIRFLLSVPSTGMPNAAPIIQANITSGSLTDIQCYYGTGGNIGIKGHNGASTVFDSGLIGFAVNGTPCLISLELTTNGTGLNWRIVRIFSNNGVGNALGGTAASTTIGAVSSVVVNPAGTIDDTALGGIVLQYAFEDVFGVSLQNIIGGHIGERAAARFTRLCTEEGITSAIIGSTSDTPTMGAQTDQKFTDLLQECENADQGLISESASQLGLAYRTRVSLTNQTPDITLDYASAHLAAVPQPVYDDANTRNDITVNRVNGGTVNTQLTTGALSIQPPPLGVGDYTFTLAANVQADTQLSNLATWLQTTGTVDEYRYPQITVDLTRAEVKGLFNTAPSQGIGDYLQVTTPPAWLPGPTIDQLQIGRTETLNAFKWTIVYNCVPQSPYAGTGQPTW